MIVRIFVVEDHHITRQGIREVLENETEILIVGESAEADDALAKIASLRPEIVLLDYKLGHMSGDKLMGIMYQQGFEGRVLILSAYHQEYYVQKSLQAGARGYMVKDESGYLAEAVKTIAKGGLYFSPQIASFVHDWMRRRGPLLTEQEEKVLKQLAQGATDKEIAVELGITEHTVRFHLGQVSQKLDIHGRGKLQAWAWQHGYAG